MENRINLNVPAFSISIAGVNISVLSIIGLAFSSVHHLAYSRLDRFLIYKLIYAMICFLYCPIETYGLT